MKRTALFIAVLAAACGGKKGPTTPPPSGDDDRPPPPSGDTTGMVPAEKMDEIKIVLDRKRMIVSRCSRSRSITASCRKHARQDHAEFVISPAGKAQDIKIIEADFESKSVSDCVIRRQRARPRAPKQVPWRSYAFEAN